MRLKFRFGIKTLLLVMLVVALSIVLFQTWIEPSRAQQKVFEQVMDCGYARLEPVAGLPIWKRGIAKVLGEHYVCDVVEAEVTVEFDGGVAAIKNFTSLKRLYIQGLDPMSQGYASIPGFVELEELVFDYAILEGDVSSFRSLTKLKQLSAYRDLYIFSGGEVFGELPELKKLHLRDTPLDQFQLDGIARSSSIEDLWIATNESATDLLSISKMNQLTTLGVNRVESGWVDLAPLLELPNLKVLNTEDAYIDDLPVLRELKQRGVTGWYLHYENE